MTTRKSDFYFYNKNLYISLIPNNKDAEKIWNDIHKVFPGVLIPKIVWPTVKKQIKDANYTIRKARDVKISDNDIKKLLHELSG